MLEHLADFVADLDALGRTHKHKLNIQTRVSRLAESCGWKMPRELSADAFVSWRSRQNGLSPKTLNEYLNAINSLLNWMERQGRIAGNPLKHVTRVDTLGKQQRRRAFTDEELNKLLEVGSKIRLLYLAAAYTGLRIGELRQVVWGDVILEGERPHILVRAATTKNRRETVVPLLRALLTS